MSTLLKHALVAGLSAAMFSLPGIALADYNVRCESHQYKYTTCRLSEPGSVSIKHQISGASCQKGRSWDFDSREIWVDDGCAAEFHVDTSSHGSSNDKKAAIAAGAIVGLALLGALASNAEHSDDHRVNDQHKYNDDEYQGSRHTSFVPKWMRGTFRGYNEMYGKEVTLTITSDGKVTGNSEGSVFKGYVNDEKLHFGSVVFDVDQTREGIVTSQTGDRQNEVNYRRVN